MLLQCVIAFLTILAGAGVVQAADRGVTRFWNLTGETITHLYLAPAGTAGWSADQCRNDPDGTVDFDERLRITGISSGHYDVRFTNKAGLSCTVKNIQVNAGAIFSIDREMSGHCGSE